MSIGLARAPTPDDLPSWDFGRLVRSHLGTQARAIDRQAERILANTTPQGVHALRVAARRTRSVLRILDSSMDELRNELKWIAGVAGHVRDADVQLASWDGKDSESGAVADYQTHLRCDRRRAAKRLRRALQSPRFAALIAALRTASETFPATGMSVEQAATEHVGGALKRVKRRGRAIDRDSGIAELHRLRVAVKRLRYLLAVFQPEYGKGLKPFSTGARKLQELLGAIHDEDVGIRYLYGYAEQLPADGKPDDLIAVGRAVRDHELALEALRERFPKAWRRFDRHCKGKALRARIARGEIKPRRAPRHQRPARG